MSKLEPISVESSAELADCLFQLATIVGQFIRIVDALIAVSVQHELALNLRTETTPLPDKVVKVLPLLLQATGSSTNTLLQLSSSPGLHTRDCYSIARTIFETATNICYIISQGDDAADRALRHARQKAFQDLKRESKIGDLAINVWFQNRPDPSAMPELEDDIREFISRSGREKGWTDLSVDDRIAIVGQKLGEKVQIDLQFARLLVYRHASEILHGTYFGALFFLGGTQPGSNGQSVDERLEFIGQQHMALFFAAIQSLSAVVEAFHLAYGFSEAHERSQALIKSLQGIAYLRQDKGSAEMS